MLGIDDCAVDVGEDLKDRADADVVSVAGNAEADLAGALEVFLEGLDADQFTDLGVAKDSHGSPVSLDDRSEAQQSRKAMNWQANPAPPVPLEGHPSLRFLRVVILTTGAFSSFRQPSAIAPPLSATHSSL